MEGYLSGVEITGGTADDWTNMPELTVRRMLWHFMHWRTTATRIMDVYLTDDSKYMAGLKTITGLLWDQVVTIATTTIYARPGVDRYNRFFCEVDPQMEASRGSIPEVITLTESDWESIRVLETHDILSMLYWSGVAVNSTGDPLAYVSLSPGHIHKRYGTTETGSNYLVSSQSQCNQMCGLYFGWKNNAFLYEIDLVYTPRLLDLFPRQYINLTVSAAEDPRGVGYSGRAVPRRLEFRHDLSSGVLSMFLVVEPETFEGLAINGDIPDSVDSGAIPPLPPLPSIPPLPPLDFSITPGGVGDESVGPSTVLISTSNFGFLYTSNFNDDSPTWSFMNTNLTTTQYNDVRYVYICPNGAIFMGCKTIVTSNFEEIWRADGVGYPWVQVYDDSEEGSLITLNVDPDLDEACIAVGGSSGNMKSLYYNTGTASFDVVASGIDAANRGSGITKSGDKWIMQHAEQNVFGSQAASRFDFDGSLEINTLNPPIGQLFSANEHRVCGGGGYVYGWNADSRYLRTYIDGDIAASTTTMPNLGGLGTVYYQLLACDPTGQYLMGGKETVIGQRSSDYGATFGPVSATLGVGYNKWDNCASPNSFLTATVQVVKYTGDFGDSWVDKSGDLAVVAPLCAIQKVKFVSW